MTSVITDKLLKRGYVGAVQLLRDTLRTRLHDDPKWQSDASKYRIWLRSLLAIHDIDEMARLDLAWWQFDALAEIDRFLRRTPGARVFEYGSGASTLWLARRARAVTSIEHDESWRALIEGKLSEFTNVELKWVPARAGRPDDAAYASMKPGARNLDFREYVHAIDGERSDFDLIVIDGRCRLSCLRLATARLSSRGMIVFDNSNRARYRSGIEASGLQRVRYRGLTPCLPYPDETTLMRRVA